MIRSQELLPVMFHKQRYELQCTISIISTSSALGSIILNSKGPKYLDLLKLIAMKFNRILHQAKCKVTEENQEWFFDCQLEAIKM